jgi:hypothetical protein
MHKPGFCSHFLFDTFLFGLLASYVPFPKLFDKAATPLVPKNVAFLKVSSGTISNNT